MRTGRRFPLKAYAALWAVILAATLAAPAAAQTGEQRGLRVDRAAGQQVRGKRSPLVWLESVLAQDRVGAWRLANGTPLQMAPGTVWRDEETRREASPTAGRRVRIMGQWRGDVFEVRQATLISQRQVIERAQPKPITVPDQPQPEQPH